MTKEEAIRILNEQRNKFMDDFIDYRGVNEAYNMAISLLKEQAKESKSTSLDDMISITIVAEFLADNATPQPNVEHWEKVMLWGQFLRDLKEDENPGR